MASRVTREEFEKRLYDKYGDDVRLIGDFKNMSTKTVFKHIKCGHEWEQAPEVIVRNNSKGCPKCNGKEKVTPELFRERVYDAVGDEYTVLEEYRQNKIPVLMRHNSEECNYHTWKVLSANFLRKNSRCPICARKESDMSRRKTNDQFLKELEDKYGNEYTPLEKYEVSSKHILVRHNEEYCNNHEWKITPINLLRGYGCPVCGLKKIGDFHRKSEDDFLAKVREVHGDKYEVLSPFKGVHEYVEVLHKECGRTWNIVPLSLQRGVGCNHCYGTHRKTTDQYKEEIRLQTNGAYEVIGEYINAHTPIRIRHVEDGCNHEFEGTPNVLMYSINCGACNGSSGEKAVAAYLRDKGYKFDTEHRFDDCRNVYPLSFDFAVFNSDGSLNCLIEYDGQQHYKPVDYWEGEEGLKKYQMRDGIKNGYCERNNIKLIRIPYWEFKNINTILDKELKDLL